MIELLLIFLSTFLPRLLVASRLQMTGDEGFYIFTGTVCLRNIVRRDFSESSWAVEYHPPLLMSLYAAAYSLYVLLRVIRRGNWSLSRVYEEGAAAFSGQRTLFAIRLLPITFVSFASIPLYLVTEELTGSASIALAAALIFALSPLSIGVTSLAILEPGLIFFYTTSLWLFVSGINHPNSLLLVLASGLLLGAAMASREGGYFLPLSIIVISIIGTISPSMFSLLNTNYDSLLAVWIISGIATLYILWPLLWRHPLARIRENFRIVARMKGEKDTGWTYNLREIVAGTPFYLSLLAALGAIGSIILGREAFGYLAALLLSVVPLLVLSRPSIPQRGIHAIFFLVPYLMILPAVTTIFIANALTQLFALGPILGFYLVLAIILGGLLIVDVMTHPYYLQHRDSIGGRFYRWGDGIGQWSEGIEEAMEYIDAHASRDSEIWIYGLKFPAMYHSKRVNVSESFKGEPLFFTRHQETGYGEFDDSEYRLWKSGDLRFYFPYYFASLIKDDLVRMLEERKVSYVVVHRWARNNPEITANSVNANNYEFITELSRKTTPEHVVRIRDDDLCWIYRVEDFLKSVDRNPFLYR